jgi:tetratricopeptide (TPR) repeat protein
MKKSYLVVSAFVLLAVVLLVFIQSGCKAKVSNEIPITTKSNEARNLFIEGRRLAEFVHGDKANEFFTKAVQADPEFAWAYLYKAGTSSVTKDFKDAMAKAVSLAPKASEAEQKLIAAAQAVYEEKNYVKAKDLYEQLAAMFPKDKRVYWYLAGPYGNLQDYDKQIANLDKALAIDKTFPQPYQDLGYVYRWKGQYDKAEQNFQEYLRLSPGEANGHDCLADLYVKMGKFDVAVDHYQKAVELDPTFVMSQTKTGTTLAFLGKYAEARQALQKAMDMELKPSYKVYDQEAIARTYIYEDNYEKALEATDKAIQMANELGLPEEAAWNPLVKCHLYWELKDIKKAEACIADCVSALENPNIVTLVKENLKASDLWNEAYLAALKKDFKTALAKADEFKAHLATYNNPAFNKFPGWLQGHIAFMQGDHAKAISLFSQGEMDDVYTMYYFGLAKEKAGDKAGAQELFKKVAEWNLDSADYAFVRAKAIAKIGK